MATTKKKAASTEAPEAKASGYQQQLEATVERLRAQVLAISEERDQLRAKAEARRRVDKPFTARKYPLNGFTVQITGRDCMESDIRVDAVGDTLVIYTGDAVEGAKRGAYVTPRTGSAGPQTGTATEARGESWSNLDGAGLPLGLGPSPKLTPEQKAKALETGSVDEFVSRVEDSIVMSKGNFTGM